MPHPVPIIKALGWKLVRGLENRVSKLFMTAIILSEALFPGDTLHSHATLSQKYPTRIYGIFKSTSFLVSAPFSFAFRFSGIAFRSLAMPCTILLKGYAPCLYSFPGSVPCSYSVILHP